MHAKHQVGQVREARVALHLSQRGWWVFAPTYAVAGPIDRLAVHPWSDIEPSDSIETCACSAFAACEARHIRSAYGAAVGPCTQDLFVVPQATGCVVERYAGCAALGRYTHEVFQEMRCVGDGIELDGLISSAEVSVSPR